jgi:2,3-bisphosphoglycerate-independent phosphoglycerate mutase
LIAETEKYAHVTYFFNGYRDTPFAGQVKELIPSRNVDRHDSEPRMMAMAIADRVVEVIKKHEFDVVVVNFANADMVAHTGNFNAGVIAVQTVDEQLGRLVTACEETGSYLVVTADHGNAEVMIDAMTGHPETTHDPSPVPIYLVGPKWKHEEKPRVDLSNAGSIGILCDVAPTVLSILGIPQPAEMTGQNLIPLLEE